MINFNLMILAAGYGKRMENLTDSKPKPLLEINNKGLLAKKEIYDLNNMNKYKFSKNKTEKKYQKDSYIHGVLTSLREKVNAPVKRTRSKKN